MKLLDLDHTDLRLLHQLQCNAALSNQDLAALVHISAATCLRRVRRLREAGLIEAQVAVLSTARFNALGGQVLCAVVEITLDRQDSEAVAAFEALMQPEDAVQQCYRVSPGPDFVLIVHVPDMPHYLALTQRLFARNANVRNVKSFFSMHRSKFGARLPLPKAAPG